MASVTGSFLQQQYDFIVLLHGLAFCLLGAVGLNLSQGKSLKITWDWLVAFAWCQTLAEWCDIFAATSGFSANLAAVQLMLRALAFVFLMEFGRQNLRSLQGRGPRRWIYGPLLLLTLIGLVDGISGLNSMLHYVFGLGGGLWAALALWSASRQTIVGRRLMQASAMLMLVYALSTVAATDSTVHLLSRYLNKTIFWNVFDLPIQLVSVMVLTGLTISLWCYSDFNYRTVTSGLRSFWANSFGVQFSILLIITLISGWLLVEYTTDRARTEIQDSILTQTLVAAAALNPGQVQGLTATDEDLDYTDYYVLHQQLMMMNDANPAQRSLYLIRQQDDEIVFLLDSSYEDDPIAIQPGEVYEDPPSGLDYVFETGEASVIGPYRDAYGSFISGFAPIYSPVSEDPVAVLGLDVETTIWQRNIARQRLAPLAITAMFSLIVVCTFIIRRRMWETHAKLAELSLIDDLTGLYNRRGFTTLANQQIKLAARLNQELVLIFADVDRLKWINDNLGHKEGDQVIKDAAGILRDTLRESDILARIGGDEFVGVAINNGSMSVESILERFRQNIARFNQGSGRTYPLSISIGVSYYDPGNPVSLSDLLAEGDQLMYNEKARKRGKIPTVKL